jgi:hypothetical protein
MTRVFLNAERYEEIPVKIKDIYFIPKPFSDEIYNSSNKLRIGHIKSIDIFPACQANQRAVE